MPVRPPGVGGRERPQPTPTISPGQRQSLPQAGGRRLRGSQTWTHKHVRTHAQRLSLCVATCLSLKAIRCHSLVLPLSTSVSHTPHLSPSLLVCVSLCLSISHCLCPCRSFAVFLSLSPPLSDFLSQCVCGLSSLLSPTPISNCYPFHYLSFLVCLSLSVSLCLLISLPPCLCRTFSSPQPGEVPETCGLTQDTASRQELENPR